MNGLGLGLGGKSGKGGKKGGKAANKTSSTKRPRINPSSQSADHSLSEGDDDDEVDRPLRGEKMLLSKKELKQLIELSGVEVTDRYLERMYRYIDLLNNTLKDGGISKLQDQVDSMEEEVAATKKSAADKEGPPFFRGNMATTIMLNGVEEIRKKKGAETSTQGIIALFKDVGVYVMDVWIVKKEGDRAVSALVKFGSRFQKITALAAVNGFRTGYNRDYTKKNKNAVNARDAFPREQLEAVQACYRRGYELKSSGKIQSYRIFNTGAEQPTFEVRREVDGKSVWGPPPPSTGDTPRLNREDRTRRMNRGEDERDPTSSCSGVARPLADEVTMDGEDSN